MEINSGKQIRREAALDRANTPRLFRLARVLNVRLSAPAGLVLSAISLGPNVILGQTNEVVTPFEYHAPQSALDDLKQRLAETRWPERETTNDWSEGVPLEKMRALVEYWRTDYEWRRCEKELNRFPQFRTEIYGLNIHFIHVRSKNPNALPIILTHGNKSFTANSTARTPPIRIAARQLDRWSSRVAPPSHKQGMK